MIGGIDFIFRTRLPAPQALDAAVRAVRQQWPTAVFQSGATGNTFGAYRAIPFAAERELLVYQDQGAFEDWEAHGATAGNENRMVHLLFPAGEELTVVVGDDTAPAMRAMLAAIKSCLIDRSLRMPRFITPRTRSAA